mmetsp:Transcript_9016/g.26636  ORF Transcript_9016/g.26636 Transcript_9016/m.26636 type:complete len:166 (-) Transcript_9016:227-724(-)
MQSQEFRSICLARVRSFNHSPWSGQLDSLPPVVRFCSIANPGPGLESRPKAARSAGRRVQVKAVSFCTFLPAILTPDHSLLKYDAFLGACVGENGSNPMLAVYSASCGCSKCGFLRGYVNLQLAKLHPMSTECSTLYECRSGVLTSHKLTLNDRFTLAPAHTLPK